MDAQTRGLCWDDRSGDTLRKWLDVDKETFYDSGKFALVPMDFYYLGDVPGDKGMEEPREWVAPTYHPAIMKLLPDVKLTILAGSYAVKYYLNQWSKARLEDTVKNFHNTCPSTSRLCIRRAVPTSGAPSIRGSMRRWCRHCASMCMPSSASEIAQFQWCKSPVFVVTANTGDFDMRALTPV